MDCATCIDTLDQMTLISNHAAAIRINARKNFFTAELSYRRTG
jgi:hypothetical protein